MIRIFIKYNNFLVSGLIIFLEPGIGRCISEVALDISDVALNKYDKE